MIRIRTEHQQDIARVRRINDVAFGQPLEGRLVDALRERCPEALSLVAEDRGEIIGHILFTPVMIDNGPSGMALGPMAVLPDRQRQGVGSHLVRRGLEILRERPCAYLVVVGHPDYYPRFGFEPATKRGFLCQWESVPEEAFMVLVLNPAAMEHVTGVVTYQPEFNTVT